MEPHEIAGAMAYGEGACAALRALSYPEDDMPWQPLTAVMLDDGGPDARLARAVIGPTPVIYTETDWQGRHRIERLAKPLTGYRRWLYVGRRHEPDLGSVWVYRIDDSQPDVDRAPDPLLVELLFEHEQAVRELLA